MDLLGIRSNAPFLLFVMCLNGALFGCQKEAPPSEMVRTHEGFLDTLRARDPVALYDLSDAELHQRMEVLYQRLNRVKAWLEEPGNETWAVRFHDALILSVFQEVSSPRDLFVAVVDFHAIDFDGSSSEGLQLETVEFDGERATVKTVGRQSFSYGKDDSGTWRSRFAIEALDMWPPYHVLLSNLTKVETFIEKSEGAAAP